MWFYCWNLNLLHWIDTVKCARVLSVSARLPGDRKRAVKCSNQWDFQCISRKNGSYYQVTFLNSTKILFNCHLSQKLLFCKIFCYCSCWILRMQVFPDVKYTLSLPSLAKHKGALLTWLGSCLPTIALAWDYENLTEGSSTILQPGKTHFLHHLPTYGWCTWFYLIIYFKSRLWKFLYYQNHKYKKHALRNSKNMHFVQFPILHYFNCILFT